MPDAVPTAIFLSYSHHDATAAQDLHGQLTGAGLAVFKDDRQLRSGDRWLQALQQALADCSAFIVLVGRDGVQRWVGAEVEVALNRHLSARDGAPGLPIHPVLLGEAVPDALPPLLALFQAERWAPGRALPAAMLDALRQGQQRLGQAPPFDGCPYLGLGSFQPQDAGLFFGRRAETLQALAGLGDQQQTAPDQLQGAGSGTGYHRWLQIEGNSGSGKSSLVLAGLLPMVQRGALWPRTGLAHWQVLGPMMPGQEPVLRLVEVLEKCLKPDGQRDTLARAQRLAGSPLALALDIRDAARPDTGCLLVIDQFEELFTLAAEPQRLQFDLLLATALADADCPLFVVSTVRADFLDRIEQLPRLAALYNQRCKRYLLPTITPEGLREAIELPAQRAGLDASQVTAAMLREARDEPGALPLVENALLQLWQLRRGKQLSGAEFDGLGGLAGMLSTSADALLARIEREVKPAGRAGALELLLRLTRINADGRHSRQRISRAEAVQVAGGGDAARGEQVLLRLSGQRPDDVPSTAHAGGLRLVTSGVEGDAPYVDLIHETLVRPRSGAAAPGQPLQGHWPTLYQYIDANRDRDVLRQQLAIQVGRWQRGGRWTRWLHLAGWGQLLDYRRLRPLPQSMEGRFLLRSKCFVAAQAVPLLMLAGWGMQAWWAELENLAAKVGYSVVYRAVLPFWDADVLLPVPETVALPALPAGQTFDMGCKPGRDYLEGKCPDGEPLKSVAMPKPCAMGKFEVTNWQFNRFAWERDGKGAAPLARFAASGIFGTPQRPKTSVTLHDIQAYAQWLSVKTGQNWRLPTEAEWEYGARGGLNAAYPWGNEAPTGRANCKDCGDAFSGKKTAPVGSYDANAYGLHDMTGNVWEWVEGKNRDGHALWVLRGGSWSSSSGSMRVISRSGGGVLAPVSHPDLIGFRVCRDSPIEKRATGALDAGVPAR